LKHSVPKGDKKKKKEVALEIAKLEEELTNRQKKELEVLKNDLTRENSQGQDVTKEIEAMSLNADNSESQSKLSKAQKRRDKKAAKEREREERIAEAELENVHSARNVEAEKLKEVLASKCLSIKEVCQNVQQFQSIPNCLCYLKGGQWKLLREAKEGSIQNPSMGGVWILS